MRSWLTIGGLILALTACGGTPETPVAAQDAPTRATPPAGARTLPIPSVGDTPADAASPGGAGPMTWDVPESWTTGAPSNTMRQAQYEAPGSAGPAECVVFYFGPGQGGDSLSNAHRWAGQFSQSDGSNSLEEMTMIEIDGGALGLQLVEVTGTYNGGMSTGMAPAEAQPDSMLLGGIADGPNGPWFFKFTGPQATVEENRDAFVALLRSIRQEI